MKSVSLSEAGTGNLVAPLAEIPRQQDKALLIGQIAKFNRLYDRMKEVGNELKQNREIGAVGLLSCSAIRICRLVCRQQGGRSPFLVPKPEISFRRLLNQNGSLRRGMRECALFYLTTKRSSRA